MGDTFVDAHRFQGDAAPANVFGKNAPIDAANIQAAAGRQGIAEQRRQFDSITAALAPFLQAGAAALPDVAGGATAGGLDERIRAILGGDAFKALLGERTRGVQGQLAAGGLTRSGAGLRAAAAIPTDVAFQIEQLLYGRQANLVGAGQNAAVQQGGFGANAANNISDLQTRIGEAMGQGVIGRQQAQSQLISTGATAAALFFSDPRLKENMAPIGKIGPLTLYEWDWKPVAVAMSGAEMSLGFDADEVEQHFPEFVFPARGFKAIDYAGLTDRLREG